jgi:hypothetical protein
LPPEWLEEVGLPYEVRLVAFTWMFAARNTVEPPRNVTLKRRLEDGPRACSNLIGGCSNKGLPGRHGFSQIQDVRSRRNGLSLVGLRGLMLIVKWLIRGNEGAPVRTEYSAIDDPKALFSHCQGRLLGGATKDMEPSPDGFAICDSSGDELLRWFGRLPRAD